MAYELNEVLNMLLVYHEVESQATEFLSFSAFAMKHKEHKIKSAQRTLKAIEEYKKLPSEIRKELEKDKNNNVSRIIGLERLCKETIAKQVGT
jgi:hypothetical protein